MIEVRSIWLAPAISFSTLLLLHLLVATYRFSRDNPGSLESFLGRSTHQQVAVRMKSYYQQDVMFWVSGISPILWARLWVLTFIPIPIFLCIFLFFKWRPSYWGWLKPSPSRRTACWLLGLPTKWHTVVFGQISRKPGSSISPERP